MSQWQWVSDSESVIVGQWQRDSESVIVSQWQRDSGSVTILWSRNALASTFDKVALVGKGI